MRATRDLHSETIRKADGFIKSRGMYVAFYTSDGEKFHVSELFLRPRTLSALSARQGSLD